MPPRKKKRYGESLLKVIQEHDITQVNNLIRLGVNVNYRDTEGNTALHISVRMHSLPIIKLLLNAGININRKNNVGQSAISLCKGDEFFDIDILILLIKSGADIQLLLSNDKTVLHRIVASGRIRILNMLIDAGARTKNRDKDGKTTLHVAAYNGDNQMVHALIAAGANVNATTKAGDSPLHLAAHYKHVEVARQLIEAGTIIDKRNLKGQTALYLACKYYKVAKPIQYQFIMLLLSNDANPNIKSYQNISILNRLFLHQKASELNVEFLKIARLLIDAGANVNHIPDREQYLVEKSTQFDPLMLNQHHRMKFETTVIDNLHYSNFYLFKLLINAGYDVNRQDNNGRTLLMKMMSSKHKSFELEASVKCLVNTGKLNVDLRDHEGKTAAMIEHENKSRRSSFFHTEPNLYTTCVEPPLRQLEKQKKASMVYKERFNPASYFSKIPTDVRRIVESFVAEKTFTYKNEGKLGKL